MKYIPGFERQYSIETDGSVYSHKSHKYLKSHMNEYGYMRIELTQNGKRNNRFVHRLVASTYISNPESKPYVNHLDCDRSNNDVANLEWCSAEENTHYSIKLGHHISSANRKLSDVQVLEIRKLRAMGMKPTHIGQKLGISRGSVNNVIFKRCYRFV